MGENHGLDLVFFLKTISISLILCVKDRPRHRKRKEKNIKKEFQKRCVSKQTLTKVHLENGLIFKQMI